MPDHNSCVQNYSYNFEPPISGAFKKYKKFLRTMKKKSFLRSSNRKYSLCNFNFNSVRKKSEF